VTLHDLSNPVRRRAVNESGELSLTLTPDLNSHSPIYRHVENLTVPQFSFLALLATLSAVAADQLLAPTLYTSSPLWAIAACMVLVWRRGDVGFEGAARSRRFGFLFGKDAGEGFFCFSRVRIALFAGAHALLILAARLLHNSIDPFAGAVTVAGGIAATLKFSVLLPTLVLLPLSRWRILARVYAAEGVAALVVLLTFFPSRILATIWPWHGQVLGGFVFYFSRLFVHGLTYTSEFTPTIHGTDLDVTILVSCSGISGIELFDYLFALVAVLDWNRLRKGRTLVAYFAGIVAMFLGNALRIASFVILGNRGFADAVANFHLAAGWIFFSLVFLAYLSLTYRKLLITAR
jgi:exosortase/archaeosortase family protein